MFGFKRHRIQRDLPPIVAEHEHALGCALLDAFSTMEASQQVCLYCGNRGGFGMSHHPNCIIGVAANRLFSLGVYDQKKQRYLKFPEHTGEIRRLREQLQKLCQHTGRVHRPGSWWCPDCYACQLTAISDTNK